MGKRDAISRRDRPGKRRGQSGEEEVGGGGVWGRGSGGGESGEEDWGRGREESLGKRHVVRVCPTHISTVAKVQ